MVHFIPFSSMVIHIIGHDMHTNLLVFVYSHESFNDCFYFRYYMFTYIDSRSVQACWWLEKSSLLFAGRATWGTLQFASGPGLCRFKPSSILCLSRLDTRNVEFDHSCGVSLLHAGSVWVFLSKNLPCYLLRNFDMVFGSILYIGVRLV